MERAAPPPLRRTFREALSLPRVLLNPLRPARKGEAFGKGRPALVIPGLATGDISTKLLRRTLSQRGFRAEGWGLGLDMGADPAKLAKVEQRLARLHEETGLAPIVIGWSLGGLYARVLALRVPQHLSMVVTVGSPFSGDRHANRAWRLYELVNDHTVDYPPFREDPAVKPPVPSLAVWSGTDGIVAPECARGDESQADRRLRLDAPHFAMGTSPDCIERIVEEIRRMEAELEGK